MGSRLFARDADFVNVVGMWSKNRQEIEQRVATPADRVWHEYPDLVHAFRNCLLLGQGALQTSIFDLGSMDL